MDLVIFIVQRVKLQLDTGLDLMCVRHLRGEINFIGTASEKLSPKEAGRVLSNREPHPGLRPNESLPDDTRLWAALQNASGGIWSGCIYDVDKIIEIIQAGMSVKES